MTAAQIYEVMIWIIFSLMAIMVVLCLIGMVWHDKKGEEDDRDKRIKRNGSRQGTNSRERRKVQTDRAVGKGMGKGRRG